MNFYKKIVSSVYDPAFYKRLPKESFGIAFGYYLLLSLFLAGLTVAFVAFPVARQVNQLQIYLDTELVTAYPQNLMISIHNGIVHTNVDEPYFIPLVFLDNRNNFIVIDTKTPFSQHQFDIYNSYVWLSKDTVFYKSDRNGEIRAYDLSKVTDFTLNKEALQNFVNSVSPWIKFLTPALLLIIFIVLYLGYLFKLIYLFLLAFIFWLIAKKMLPGLSYANSYKVALHAVTLGFLISAGLAMLNAYTHVYTFPFMETIVTITVFVSNFWKTKTSRKSTKKK